MVGSGDLQRHHGATNQQDTGVGDWTRERKVSRGERRREGGLVWGYEIRNVYLDWEGKMKF